MPPSVLCFDEGQVVVITANAECPINVQIARTPEEWEQGLRGVDALHDNEGMLFLFPRERILSFTTAGVAFPIDILLINKVGRIIGKIENASGDQHHASPFPILAALEVPAGFCRKTGVRVGDPVFFRDIAMVPKAAPHPKEDERQKVEQDLLENLKQHPDNPALYEELAVFYIMSGQAAKAVDLFRQLIDKEATAPRLNGLGVALNNMGRRREAESYFYQAIDADPLFYSSYNNLVMMYQRQNNDNKAVELLRDALDRYPEFLQARLGLAWLHLKSGDIPAAETLMDAVGQQPDLPPEAIRLRGDIHLRNGEFAQAAEAYLAYLQANPYDPYAADLRVFILMHKVKPGQRQMN